MTEFLDKVYALLALWACLLATIAALCVLYKRLVPAGFVVRILIYWGLYYVALFGGRAVQELYLDLTWNWVGKIIAIILTIAIFKYDKKLSWKGSGIQLRQAPNSIVPGMIVVILTVGLSVAIEAYLGGPGPLNRETFLYQFFMPSIDEELFYRALFFVLTAAAYLQFDLPNGKWFTPQIVLTSVIFGYAHALSVSNGEFGFNIFIFLFTGAIGWTSAWVRQRTGSILLPMVLHTGVNIGARLV